MVVRPCDLLGERPTWQAPDVHPRYPVPPENLGAAIRRRVLRNCSLLPSSNPLPPFAVWPALPAPDYYGGSAPPGHSAVGVPIPASGPGARRREPHRAVPVFTVVRSADQEPGCVPAASP